MCSTSNRCPRPPPPPFAQNLDSSEISLTDVSHYFDSDPTKLVAGLRDDGKMPSAFIADTTTANAQVRAAAARAGPPPARSPPASQPPAVKAGGREQAIAAAGLP